MRLMMEIGADRCWENLFTADEVVVIILYKAEVALYRDIVFAKRMEDGNLLAFFNIYVYHVVYILLTYLLMFLFGDYKYY